MEQAIAIIFISQIVNSIGILCLIFEISKTLKELEKDVIQENNQDV